MKKKEGKKTEREREIEEIVNYIMNKKNKK